MSLTSEQIRVIESIINESNLTIPSLKDDLLDHLCCDVEDKMAKGENFRDAAQQSVVDLAPNGFEQIQYETEYLLNIHKTISMKKLMFLIGLATSISMTMGLMMKLLHMPGGEELVNFGFLAFALIFLPMLTFSRYKENQGKFSYEKAKIVFGFLSALFTGLAVLFKMKMDLDISTVMLMTGASLFSFGFLPLQFFTMYRKSIRHSIS
jgi:hypothetical protein